MALTNKGARFSYSKLNTYETCAFKYHLTYEKNHYIFSPSLASDYGVLVHYCEEQIARTLQMGMEVNYEKLKKEFVELNVPKDPKKRDSGIMGINALKNKYKGDYFSVDDNGMSYHTKSEFYLSEGIYRLEKFLKEHPTYEIYGMEQFFSISFGKYTLSGYIDRIFHDKETGAYIIEDIKTKSHRFKDKECVTPLQFVLYANAIKSMTGATDDQIICQYDLPFCDEKQPAGTKGFIKRGMDKIKDIFVDIEKGDRAPKPSPLCYFCQFCHNNPEVTKEGDGLCPYYSHWSRTKKDFSVENEWEGLDNNDRITMEHQKKYRLLEDNGIDIKFDFDF